MLWAAKGSFLPFHMWDFKGTLRSWRGRREEVAEHANGQKKQREQAPEHRGHKTGTQKICSKQNSPSSRVRRTNHDHGCLSCRDRQSMAGSMHSTHARRPGLCWLARAKGKAGRRGSQGMHWLQDTAEAPGLMAVGTRPPVQPGHPAHHPTGGISLMPTVPLEKD